MSFRVGFTLIELLVVMAVIAALAAIGLPVLNVVRHRGNVSATVAVVQSVAMLTAQQQARSVTVPQSDGSLRVFPLFDVNGDGILDGDPQLEDAKAGLAKYPAEVLADSELYGGFVHMASPSLPERHVESDTLRVIDAWGFPLRIAYSTQAYGSSGIGIWSVGPDGETAPLNDARDDIRSWEITNE